MSKRQRKGKPQKGRISSNHTMMSESHRDSLPCTIADLQLTSVPDTCTDIASVLSVEVPSLISRSDNSRQPLEFVYHSSPDCYVQLSDSYPHIKSRILNLDGSPLRIHGYRLLHSAISTVV